MTRDMTTTTTHIAFLELSVVVNRALLQNFRDSMQSVTAAELYISISSFWFGWLYCHFSLSMVIKITVYKLAMVNFFQVCT